MESRLDPCWTQAVQSLTVLNTVVIRFVEVHASTCDDALNTNPMILLLHSEIRKIKKTEPSNSLTEAEKHMLIQLLLCEFT